MKAQSSSRKNLDVSDSFGLYIEAYKREECCLAMTKTSPISINQAFPIEPYRKLFTKPLLMLKIRLISVGIACLLVGACTPLHATKGDSTCGQIDDAKRLICKIDEFRRVDLPLTLEQVANNFGYKSIREAPQCLGQDCREFYLSNSSELFFRPGARLIVRPREPDRLHGFYVDFHGEIDDSKLCITLSDIEDAFGSDYRNNVVLTRKINSDEDLKDFKNSVRGLAGHIYYKYSEATKSSMSFRFSYRPCANLMNFSKRISIKGE